MNFLLRWNICCGEIGKMGKIKNKQAYFKIKWADIIHPLILIVFSKRNLGNQPESSHLILDGQIVK